MAPRTVIALFLLLSVLALGPIARGQDPSKPPTAVAIPVQKPVEEKLDSKLMGREMPYRVILPERSFDIPGTRYPVIYLLHGLSGHYDNWTEKTKLVQYAMPYRVIIVMPEGGDGWYTDSAVDPKGKFESYIVKELIPEIDRKYRTIADRDHRAIAGLSMGGYGAMKFAFKYPELFVLAGSFSGALGAAEMTEKNTGALGKFTDAVFGPEGSETRNANDLFKLASAATPASIAKLPYLYLDCGTEDFLFKSNKDFVALLNEKKIPHGYREMPGAHTWPYWDTQVQEFLRVAARKFEEK